MEKERVGTNMFSAVYPIAAHVVVPHFHYVSEHYEYCTYVFDGQSQNLSHQ